MKTWLVFFVVLICVGCNGSTEPTKATATQSVIANNRGWGAVGTLDDLWQQVDRDTQSMLVAASLLKRTADLSSWLGDVERLKPYLQEQLPQLSGKTLRIVLEQHDDQSGGGLSGAHTSKASQAKLYRLLENSHPRLLSLEGCYMNRFSQEAFIAEVSKSVRQISVLNGEPEPGPMPPGWFEQISQRNRMIDFAVKHPEVISVGGEWRGVHMLDVLFMSPNAPVKAKLAFIPGSRLRSLNTAARMNSLMQQYKMNECFIVIGLFHQEDFQLLSKLFGVKFVFYNTVN